MGRVGWGVLLMTCQPTRPMTVTVTASDGGAVRTTRGGGRFGKVIGRLECGVDADKWIVTVATAACWKGMLNLAATASSLRPRREGDLGAASPAPASARCSTLTIR
jgi:hypothetical protein